MTELAEIMRRYGPSYAEKYGHRLSHSQRQAMWDIEHCRTETLGGQVYQCDDCQQTLYSYHSCKNRHCPKCQNEVAQAWLVRQHEQLLSTP